MFDSLTTLGRKLFARSKKARARSEKRLQVEGLEDRKLLTASINGAGSLVVSQTTGNDTCYVRETASQYAVTEGYGSAAKTVYFAKSQVRSGAVIYYGGNGNDYFQNSTSLRTWAYGGAGDDYLWGGKGADVLYGESGKDNMWGGVFGTTTNTGNDWMNGGDGDDILYSHDGNDNIGGGAGIDQLFAGAGNDLLYGEAGNDYLHGEAGNDSLFGGAGLDTLYGSYGNDYLDGGGNNDYIDVGVGNDVVKRYAVQRVAGFDPRFDRWA